MDWVTHRPTVKWPILTNRQGGSKPIQPLLPSPPITTTTITTTITTISSNSIRDQPLDPFNQPWLLLL